MYITFYQQLNTQQNEQNILFGYINPFEYTDAKTSGIIKRTVNKPKKELEKFFEKNKRSAWYNLPQLPDFPIEDIAKHYESFKIPKKSGGLRQIDAPDAQLKKFLSNLKFYFEEVLRILPHECAHAYTKERSTITCMQVHQDNQSNWFLKLDLQDFFQSHTLTYVMKKLENLYPIGFLMKDKEYKEKLKIALSYGFLNDKLPQGTPLSPTLTNILMCEIDDAIQRMLWYEKKSFVYTRYADDMIISAKYDFTFSTIQNKIISILKDHNTPFKVKESKTRYGSKNGRNWNLGLMLNKDNQITLGYRKNQRFRAMLHNFLSDYKSGIRWSQEDRYELAGQVAYHKAVEREYTEFVINRLEDKLGVKYQDAINPDMH